MELMKKIFILLVVAISLFANDIVQKNSSCNVDETVYNLKKIIRSRNLSIFALINHSANAKAVDMKLNESMMIIFGNPELGTSLMQQDMRVGLDLPLRILVYKDKNNQTKIAYRDGSWLVDKHVLNASAKITKLNAALDQITTEAGICKRD
jgi:uncharacterized protein (DUF302 family)